MEKEQKINVCYRCGYFTRYYTRGLYRYTITKQGFCKKQQKIVASLYTCENWRNGYKRLSYGKKYSLKVLSELLVDISAIRQIIQEEKEEKINE